MNDAELKTVEISHQPAENFSDLEVGERQTSAGGLTAITQSIQYAYGEMGAARGAQTLLKLNQKGGIDCQSCAWADPHERTLNEFCENGAKALADEATTKIIGAEFFQRYSCLLYTSPSPRD